MTSMDHLVMGFLRWPTIQYNHCNCPINFLKICHPERHSNQHKNTPLDVEFVAYTLIECVDGLLEFLISYQLRAVPCIFGKLNTILWRIFTECDFWSTCCDYVEETKTETFTLELWYLMPKRNIKMVSSSNSCILDPLIHFLYSMGESIVGLWVNLIIFFHY